MADLSISEMLFYGGIGGMVLTVILTIAGIAVFCITGSKLRKKLEEEYGKRNF